LSLIQEQIAELERERDEAPTSCTATEKKRVQLTSLKGIGSAIAAVMSREIYYRQFDNRRQLAGFLGLATSPYDSGGVERCQGISRAGRSQVRACMIQVAWLWLKHQPTSAISCWFVQRTTGQSKRSDVS
jgi:transposase